MTARNSSIRPEPADLHARPTLFDLRFWITIALCAVIYLPSLAWGLGLDQNIFGEIASLLLHGKKLYVDAWDVKPPNVFYVYALFESVFGPNGFAVRLSDYIFALCACAALYAWMSVDDQLHDPYPRIIPPLATILLALTLLSLGLADTAQTESYSLVLIIGAAYLIYRPSNKRLLIAGALIGCATFFKTTNAIFLLPIATEILLRHQERARKEFLFLVLGFIGWCAVQVIVLALEGSLAEYFHIAVSVFQNHPNEVSSLQPIDFLLVPWRYLDVWSVLTIAAIVCAFLGRNKLFFASIRLPFMLFLAGMLAVLLQNKGWGYQYVVFLPGLVPLVAISCVYLFKVIRKRSRTWAAIAGLTVILVIIIVAPSQRRRIHYTSDALLSLRHHAAYVASLGSRHSLYYPACTDSLAQYLRLHSAANDEIFIFGEEPGAYWKANRMPATRYVYALLFTSGVIPPDEIRALNDTLVKKQPALIVIERFDTLRFRGKPETSESIVATDTLWSPLKNLLAEKYRAADTLCENFVVYKSDRRGQ